MPFKEFPPLWQGDTDGEEVEQLAEGAKQYGVCHTPSQFVRLAELVKHPCVEAFAVEDNARRNLFDLLTKGKSYVAKQRIDFARNMASLAKELQYEEERYFATLPEHAQRVLKGKKLLLFRHLLKDLGCPDLEPADLMVGAELVGTPSKSPLFDTKIKPATSTPAYALLTSKWLRKKLEARNVHQDDPELSQLLWDTTLQEVEAGFLEGPFSDVSQVQSAIGQKDFVRSRRFVIAQSGKPRVIDDFKESGINRAYTAIDKLALRDIDYVAPLARLISSSIARAMDHGGKVSIRLGRSSAP